MEEVSNSIVKLPCVGKCQCRPGFYLQATTRNAPCLPWILCRVPSITPPRPPIPDPTGGSKPWNWWGVPPPPGPTTTDNNQHREKANNAPRVQNKGPVIGVVNSADQSNKTEKAPKKQDQAPIGVQIFCARNSHRTTCPPCEGTCTNTHPICSKRPCLLDAPPRCECDSGFVRSGGQCIPISRCPRPRCPTNQVWKKCPTPCEPSCRNPWPTCNFNIKLPCVGKCQCRPGF
ncbi:hypothetical protein PRIPAC_72041, partial [Pristionchus pacificus]